MDKKTEALKLALEALDDYLLGDENLPFKCAKAITAIREALAEQPAQQQLTDLQKDAANLLFALHDAWPYVHQWCTIESKKRNIVHLMRKHGDFADLYAKQQQEPVAWATQMGEYAHIKWGAKRPEYPMVYEIPLYTSPPASKPWVGLTDEEIQKIWRNSEHMTVNQVAQAIEAKLKEKNHG